MTALTMRAAASCPSLAVAPRYRCRKGEPTLGWRSSARRMQQGIVCLDACNRQCTRG